MQADAHFNALLKIVQQRSLATGVSGLHVVTLVLVGSMDKSFHNERIQKLQFYVPEIVVEIPVLRRTFGR